MISRWQQFLGVSLITWALFGCSQAPTLALTPIPDLAAVQIATFTAEVPLQSPVPTLIQSSSTPAPTLAAPSQTPSPLPTLTDPLACPVDPPTSGWCILPSHFILQRPISLPYVDTVDPTYRYASTQGYTREAHHGVEFYNAEGTPVQAATAGVILVAGLDNNTPISPWPGIYGNAVVIEHHIEGISQTVYTVYGHLSKVLVAVGDTVTTGQYIGLVGATGAALGSHLHFEVRLGEDSFYNTSNPELWLQPHADPSGTQNGALAGQVIPINLNTGRVLQLSLRPIINGVLSETIFYVETYDRTLIHRDDPWQEHFALGDIPPGDYRLVLVANGKVRERLITIFPGKLTWVAYSLDQ